MQLPPLTSGRILRRYKRFLADVELDTGEVVVAHCPNTGAMTSCWEPGAPVQMSYSDNPKRKLSWTLERIDMGAGWIGVNTNRVNAIVAQAIEAGEVKELAGFNEYRREPRFDAQGHPGSRFDMFCSGGRNQDAYVEVKNATLLIGDTIAFPDAVTTRGKKHLELLEIAVARGFRGVILFAINRPEGKWFEPAREIDPDYADTLSQVTDAGVEAVVVRLKHLPDSVIVSGSNSLNHPA